MSLHGAKLVLGALSRSKASARRERMPREALESWQTRRLRELVATIAARSPFYRAHWGGAPGPDVMLRELPPVPRELLMGRFDEAVTDRRLTARVVDAHLRTLKGDPLLFGRYRAMASSGSTGQPGRFIYSNRDWEAFLDGMFRWTRFMGVRPRWPRLRMSAIGAPDARHMTYRAAASIDIGLFATQRLSAAAPLPSLIAALNAHQPEVINAYPSILVLLAEAKREGRLTIAPRLLSTSSEERSPDMTERIKDAFGVSPFDCYATTETGVTAVDCDAHTGLHVFEDQCIVEILDDAGRPAPPGTAGAKVLLTNLWNETLPMIRVEVSDVLVELPGNCSCGRTFRRLGAVAGRADDILTLRAPDGESLRVHPIGLRKELGACSDLVQYRVTWFEDVVHVEVVPRQGAAASDVVRSATTAVSTFARESGATAPEIAVRCVPAIERSATAKLRSVMQLDARAPR